MKLTPPPPLHQQTCNCPIDTTVVDNYVTTINKGASFPSFLKAVFKAIQATVTTVSADLDLKVRVGVGVGVRVMARVRVGLGLGLDCWDWGWG